MSWSSPFLSWFVKSDLSCLAHPTFTPECKTIRMNTEQNPIPFTIYRGPCFAATHLDLFDPFDSATGRWCRFGFSGHALRAVRRFHQDAGHVEWESHAENKDEMIKRWQDCGVMWRDLKEPRAWLDSSIKRVLDYILLCRQTRLPHSHVQQVLLQSYPRTYPVLPAICGHWGMPFWQLLALRVLERKRPAEMGNLMYASRRLGNGCTRRKSFAAFIPEKKHNPVDPCMVHLRYLPTFWLILW